MITIVDYGMGNLRSVQKGFEKLGFDARVTEQSEEIRRAEKLVLPGVGAFADAMQGLRSRQMVEPVRDFISSGRPFFGICLGMQLLFDWGYEDGEYEGLGVLPGKVVRFAANPGYKVPHMGWNQLRVRRPAPLLNGVEDGSFVYFVHSYYVLPMDDSITTAETDYGGSFTSIVWRDNIFATQFHPEKSQQVGLRLLRNFAEL
jgi:imidazole glycerol-phosphate synthase subunit HisH